MKKNEQLKLNIIRLLCFISIVISIICIRNTYAKYYENVATNYDVNIKRWLIKINNQDIIDNSTVTNGISATFVENEYMNNNVLVPTAQYYVDIELDYTEVDLSFEIYDMNVLATGNVYEELENDELIEYTEILEDLRILKIVTVEENEETEILLPYTVEIGNENEDTTISLRIYFEWNDGIEENMNDDEDTNFEGMEEQNNNHNIINYKANITFRQYIPVANNENEDNEDN